MVGGTGFTAYERGRKKTNKLQLVVWPRGFLAVFFGVYEADERVG